MTDWEKQLKQRRAAIRRAEQALEETIADAYDLGGLSWRKIGAAAEVNHEWARKTAAAVRERREAGPGADPLPADPVANPRRTRAAGQDTEPTMPGEYTPDLTRLTHRERSIIDLLADGKELVEIASLFGVQRERVAQQRRNARRKLGVTTEPQWQAVLRASQDEA
ncbi:hypothetical protein E6W39_24365 [Kitasatospora acidiphila]|uniref:HTH luxR-type domain-containing protein n=1 Tax=Kitasatospora acidiphila TaxID=2567942 RepID=A0A540W739_9ACTN|nr:LuxR C-terminal-related transcriptional regulator [Kitasatospora acidiphila]TQF04787.1 hypothetical protein E6W39_24365 [Kitasatospora acidiphila]